MGVLNAFRGSVALGLWLSCTTWGAEVGRDLRVANADELTRAAREAKAGSVILLEPGDYQGPVWIRNIQGTAEQPILIVAADPTHPPVILGKEECVHISQAAHLELRNLTLRKASGNGLNIDDGGTYDTPTHHITIRGLRVSEVGPSGNKDGIKLSGIDDFLIADCVVERWGSGGSGINMVGCHRGQITNCVFRDGGADAIQAKGGTKAIHINHCRFMNYGQRGINIGGNTGLEFFRPKLETFPSNRRYEAADVTIEHSVFVGGTAPFAFVGVDGAMVRRCTIYKPDRWVIRILQETRAPGFVPSRNGRFEDNIVVFDSARWFEGGVNIGPNTAPETFQFARNLWFCEDKPEQSKPRLPTSEKDGIYGKDPLLNDPASGDFSLDANSPGAK